MPYAVEKPFPSYEKLMQENLYLSLAFGSSECYIGISTLKEETMNFVIFPTFGFP